MLCDVSLSTIDADIDVEIARACVCVCVCVCRYPVCDTIINGQVHSSNLTHIAEVCNSTDGCEG